MDRGSPYHSLRQDSISQLAKEHKIYIRKALDGEIDGTAPEAMTIINKIRDIVQLVMIRRTDDSAIHGHKVVTIPKITWLMFCTFSVIDRLVCGRMVETFLQICRILDSPEEAWP